MIGNVIEKSKCFEQEGIYGLLLDVVEESNPNLQIADKLMIIQKVRHKYLLHLREKEENKQQELWTRS